MPTVTSRSSAPSSGCHVRSRWSSSSWGSRRLTARIIISTYSAIGRLKTPRALVMTRPRCPAGRRQHALDARPTPSGPRPAAAPGRAAGRTHRPPASRAGAPRRRRAGRRPGPRSRPLTIRAPGRRGADPLEVADPVAGRQDRASGRSPPARRPAGRGPARRVGRPVRLEPGAGVPPRRSPRHPAEDPGDPALGRLDLAVARQRLRAVPEAGQGRRPRPVRRWPARTARPSCTARA